MLNCFLSKISQINVSKAKQKDNTSNDNWKHSHLDYVIDNAYHSKYKKILKNKSLKRTTLTKVSTSFTLLKKSNY